MSDRTVLDHISELVDEEHKLFNLGAEGHPLSPEEHQRLENLQVDLDRCWDLLRQRRALRAAGENPDEAHERDAATVESYLQ